MAQHQLAALGQHDVVIQVLLQPFPQFQRMRIEFRIARQKVIGPHNRGIAPHIAAADIALFQHGDVFQPMLLGQVIGRRQPMPAAADDDDIVFGFRFRITPDRPPALVAGQPFFQDLPR